MPNSKRKGSVGEREAAAALREYFDVDARRGQQFRGTPDSPDVVADLPFHIEVKRTERLRLREAVEQVKADCGDGQIPLVLHRYNRGPWLAILELADLAKIFKKALSNG